MRETDDGSELATVRGAIYFRPTASNERLAAMRRFVRETARGRTHWGMLRQYPMLEFDTIDDLTAVRTRFARYVEAYVDFLDER